MEYIIYTLPLKAALLIVSDIFVYIGDPQLRRPWMLPKGLEHVP
jgi:hypothetical protein